MKLKYIIKNIEKYKDVEANLTLLKNELTHTPLYLEGIIEDYSENFTTKELVELLENYKPKILNPQKDKKELNAIFDKILTMEFTAQEHLLIYCEIIEKSFDLKFEFLDFLFSFNEEKYELSFKLFYTLWEDNDFLRVNEYPDIDPIHKQKVIEAIEAIYHCPLGGRYIKKHYDHLYSLLTNIHPDLNVLLLKKENPEYIYLSIYKYEPLILNPIDDKNKLKILYNNLIEDNEEEHSQSEMIEYLNMSFDPFDYSYIFYPEDIDKNRTEPYSFEEFYQIWLNNRNI